MMINQCIVGMDNFLWLVILPTTNGTKAKWGVTNRIWVCPRIGCILTSSQMSRPTAKMNGHDIPMDFSTGNAITARPMSCGRALLVSFMAAPVCFCPTERMDPVGFLRKKPLADQPGWSKKPPFWMVKHGETPCQRPWYIHIFSHSAGMSKRIAWNDLCVVGIKPFTTLKKTICFFPWWFIWILRIPLHLGYFIGSGHLGMSQNNHRNRWCNAGNGQEILGQSRYTPIWSP